MDASAISDRLGRMAEAVCRHYLPKGRRSGNYWSVGDAGGSVGRSLFVRLQADTAGRLAGRWQDAATGEYGDMLDLIREARGLRHFGDVLSEACHFLGYSETNCPAVASADASYDSGHGYARLFMTSLGLAGTLAEAYLKYRGIQNFQDARALRYQPACRYRANDGASSLWAALIAGVTDIDGRLTAVHRTYLDPALDTATLGKAKVETPRKSLGLVRGNAVRFGPSGSVMACGEGIETVLSLRTLAPDLPSVAVLSASNLAALILPEAVQRLYVIRDNDAAGRWAARRLFDRATEAGRAVIVVVPRMNDLNDDLRTFGLPHLQAAIGRQFTAEDRNAFLPRQLEAC